MAQPNPIPVEDGSELTRQAWQLLVAEGEDLGLPDIHVEPISDFLRAAEVHRTSTPDRQTILDQATLIFDHLYPHMPFKTDVYNFTHPSVYIRQEIQPDLDGLGEIEFHSRMITAFSLVRDAHTLYGLPSPYRGAVAFLPFQMRSYLHPKAGWRFIVTSVMNTRPDGGFGHPFFGAGAEIVHWGDMETLAHVERTEAHLPGGNFYASFARGAMHSTLRPLIFIQPPFPDEMPAAAIYYRPLGSGEIRAIRIPWAVATGFGAAPGFNSSVFSVSPATAATGACGRFLHHRPELRDHQKLIGTQDPNQLSTIPEIFDFQYTGGPPREGAGAIDIHDLTDSFRPDARFGYIRIKAFTDGASAPGSTDRIVGEFRRILTLLDEKAPDGLVIDIRNNPGGDVPAAERMLQMLTARAIQPINFHLANTPVMLQILRRLKASMTEPLSVSDHVKIAASLTELQAWLQDAEQEPLPQGSRLTSGRPLTDPDSANDIGQIYQGRGVVLLINSLTYSAADIFAAGFQDHGIGLLIGTSLVTGGGGGNVWSHHDLINKLGPKPGIPLENLPGDASMTLAIRRCSRVGSRAGEPVEDQGVEADICYWADSVEDVIFGNPGVLRRACEEFRTAEVFRVDTGPAAVFPDGGVTVEVRTTNISTLKFFLNGRLALTVEPDTTATQTYTVPAAGLSTRSVLRIEGYAPDLVRARTIPLHQPAAPLEFDPATDSIGGTDGDNMPGSA